MPVQGDQSVLADGLLFCEFGEVFVDAKALIFGGLVVFRRDPPVLGEPTENVANSGLACFVAPPQAVHDAAVDDSAHAGDFAENVPPVHYVAGGSAHDRYELSWFNSVRGRRADVGVHIAYCHGDSRRKPGPSRGFFGEVTGGVAQAADRVFEFAADKVLESRIEGSQKVLGRVLSILVNALVASRAGVADVAAAKLPNNPVRGLNPVIHGAVDFGIFLEELQPLANSHSEEIRPP